MPIIREIASLAVASIIALALPATANACAGSVHIEVRQSGVYALDYETIVAQQPALKDCRSDDLVLTERGHEVPLRILGDAGGRFAAGARIVWVGAALHGPQSWFDTYSPVNVYLLSAAPGAHARMHPATMQGASAGEASLERRLHIEQDNELIRLNSARLKPGDEPDFWYWAKLTHADPAPLTAAFDLPDLGARAGRAGTVTATLAFRGISIIGNRKEEKKPVDHAVDVALNGRHVATLQWDGLDETRLDVALPVGLLEPKGNALVLQVPTRLPRGDADNPIVDVVMFNWLELSYPIDGNLDASNAAFAVAGAKAPATIEVSAARGPIELYTADGRYHEAAPASNGRYRAAGIAPDAEVQPVVAGQFRTPDLVRAVADGDLRHADPGYDYLIISHPSLIDAIGPLADFHRRQGRKVAVVDVDRVYDEFNGGIVHPRAIRDMIAWGYAHWQLKPRYVLLVGTASFDIRASGQPISMQPASFDPRTGVPFAKRPDRPVDGGDAAAAPANRNLVPTWQYPTEEGQSASDNNFVALVDGDFRPTIAIGRFPVVTAQEVEAIVKKTLAYAASPTLGTWRSKVMFIANEDSFFQKASDKIAAEIGQQGFTADKIYGNSMQADNLANQAAINASLNAGELLVHFLGHGGRFIWRTGPPDPNKNHDLFTLDDVSNLHNDGRLPMVLSMTCFSAPFDNPSEDSIGERFLREPDRGAVAVFAASWSNYPNPDFSQKLTTELLKPGTTIGDAIVAAKRAFNNRTLVEMYNLLGDPALVLERPRDSIRIIRAGDRWRDVVAVRIPESGFGGAVTVTWLDAAGNIILAHTYEARESQFTLAVPSTDAAQVQVYAANFRTGRDALGGLDLRPPPPAPPAPPKQAPRPPARPAAPPAPAPGEKPVAARTPLPDSIATRGFGNPRTADARRARRGADGSVDPASTLRPAIAVEPGPGERQSQQ